MLLREMTQPLDWETYILKVEEVAKAALVSYDAACADPKVVIPTAHHAAMLALRKALEGK